MAQKLDEIEVYRRVTERGIELKRRILANSCVNLETGCIEWTARRCQDGYGQMQFRKKGETRIHRRAHQVAYMLWNGFIPDGMLVTHRCDNPSCVNPDHLRLGTRQTNMIEMSVRGRCSNRRRQLADGVPEAIANDIGSITNIAERHGVSRPTAMKYRKCH